MTTETALCRRDQCSCTGLLSELHAKVDAHCADSLARSVALTRTCETEGHVRPAVITDRWMRRVVRCERCRAVLGEQAA